MQLSGPLATAFGHTFIWAAAIAFVAVLPAIALLCAERSCRRPDTVGEAAMGNAAVEVAANAGDRRAG